MNTNPYSPPSSVVESPSDPQQFELHDPRTVGLTRGFSWIGEGFEHFKQDPGPWILICIVGFAIMLVLNFIPYVNVAAGLLTSVWVAGLMLGCKAQDDGDNMTVAHLFAGFQNKFGTLILLGFILMIASFSIMWITMGSAYTQLLGISLGTVDPNDATLFNTENFLTAIVLPFLISMLFLIPIMMAAWFAPLLIVLNDVPIFQAMKMSFIGCLKNFFPFLLYGIVMLVLYVVACIPLLLGLLVLVPSIFGSMYRSYKDIYINT